MKTETKSNVWEEESLDSQGFRLTMIQAELSVDRKPMHFVPRNTLESRAFSSDTDQNDHFSETCSKVSAFRLGKNHVVHRTFETIEKSIQIVTVRRKQQRRSIE
jgi:hypothetical protein